MTPPAMKWFAVVGMLLFLGVIVAPSLSALNDTKIQTLSNGNTLYVGGSGPGNYTRIQDAIDNATDSDTVYVYDDSSPYYEHLLIETSITLIGENKKTTIIDGNMIGTAIMYVNANYVNIYGFTIQNSGNSKQNDYGIRLFNANDCSIFDNIFENNDICIMLWHNCDYNIISNNTITNSDTGVYLAGSSYNTITYNKIQYTGRGIRVAGVGYPEPISDHNSIHHNTIFDSTIGLLFHKNKNSVISKNNFIDNKINVFYTHATDDDKWTENYWNNPRVFPKLIPGFFKISIDWHPAQTPYAI
ncbi:MAG: right-handed parallel beta-helix repeat-containing protein [Candidatus Thermoplasmatota archaeon]|nr:right-handed parallel beta-helix repeat-containing protein [Candidatus Thermoplasmatota archaeon]MBU1940663.1 right-handed parallel beta-helix repeat-containing protein [Candidatus Thermoplasmatota archaeon]